MLMTLHRVFLIIAIVLVIINAIRIGEVHSPTQDPASPEVISNTVLLIDLLNASMHAAMEVGVAVLIAAVFKPSANESISRRDA